MYMFLHELLQQYMLFNVALFNTNVIECQINLDFDILFVVT